MQPDRDGGGVLYDSISAVGNPYFFTGRRFDAESGLYYYRARMYHAGIARFLQPDPLGYTDSMNLYQYCGNNPINWIDPYGLSFIDFLEDVVNGIEAFENSVTGQILDAYSEGALDGAAAWADGFIPFADPFEDTYDKCEMGFSRGMGMVSETAITTAAGVGAGRAIGFIDDIPQGNNYFRVISKPLKAGFRIDKAHHGKWIHSHFWRW